MLTIPYIGEKEKHFPKKRIKARRVEFCSTRRAYRFLLSQAANCAPVRTQSLTVTTLSATTADASPFGCTVST